KAAGPRSGDDSVRIAVAHIRRQQILVEPSCRERNDFVCGSFHDLTQITQCCDSRLRSSWQRDRNARAQGRFQRVVRILRRMAFVCRCIKHLNPPGLASLFVDSRAYQMSVTLPARVPLEPLWTRIVSALAFWMSTWWPTSMYTMWPVPPMRPLVMAAEVGDSKPTHVIKVL